MYRIVTLRERIRVPPEKLNMKVSEAVKSAIADRFEGVLNQRIGMIVSVVDVDKVEEGRILPNDPGVYYNTVFNLLTFKPESQELVNGEVIDNTEFGSFVRIGPMDGLIHISQLMDDFVSFDNKNSLFLGKESKRTLKEGDLVRARIISASSGKDNKIGLTMRQNGLGNIAWIEEDKKKKGTKKKKTKEK